MIRRPIRLMSGLAMHFPIAIGVSRRRGHWYVLSVLLCSAMVATACGSSNAALGDKTSGTAKASATAKPYNIYALLGVTGAEAALGTVEKQALQKVETVVNSSGGINGHQLHFIIEDNKSTPSVAVSLAAAIIAKRVPIFFNGSVGATDSAVDALIGNSTTGPVDYDLSPVYQAPADSYIFSTAASVLQNSEALFTYAKNKGWNRVAILTTTDASGTAILRSFTEVLKMPQFSGLQVVASETADPSAVSMTTQVAKIAAAKPQVVFAGMTGPPLGVLLKAASQFQLTDQVPFIVTDSNADRSIMHAYAGILPKTILFGSQRYQAGLSCLSGQARTVTQQFYTAWGRQPGSSEGFAWDPAMVVVQALKTLGTDATAQQIHSYIESLTGYQGVMGPMDFNGGNQRGLGLNSIYITKWNPTSNSWVGVSGPGGMLVAGGC